MVYKKELERRHHLLYLLLCFAFSVIIILVIAITIFVFMVQYVQAYPSTRPLNPQEILGGINRPRSIECIPHAMHPKVGIQEPVAKGSWEEFEDQDVFDISIGDDNLSNGSEDKPKKNDKRPF